jgi:hypothetical protein
MMPEQHKELFRQRGAASAPRRRALREAWEKRH